MSELTEVLAFEHIFLQWIPITKLIHAFGATSMGVVYEMFELLNHHFDFIVIERQILLVVIVNWVDCNNFIESMYTVRFHKKKLTFQMYN